VDECPSAGEANALIPIEIENLSKVYFKGMKMQKVMAVKDLTLAVEEGEIFGFVGPNGAGKSTTIKILCHLIRPTSGRVTLMGRDVTLAAARQQMGYLPENPSYYDYLTGEELLAFNGAIHGMKEDRVRQRSRQLLEVMELGDAANRLIRTFSKGMVQRLGIVASLIHDPQVLIWDEPMSGLDPIGRKQTADLMRELRRQGKSIFFSTHILADVEHVCDRIGMIVNGELSYAGRLEEIFSTATEHYHVVFRIARGAVASLPEPQRLATYGDRYQLEVAPKVLGSTMEQLLSQGAEIISIEPRRSRLEDLFVTLTQKH
jgi:ABC-2 type transport system ATP-binding protein